MTYCILLSTCCFRWKYYTPFTVLMFAIFYPKAFIFAPILGTLWLWFMINPRWTREMSTISSEIGPYGVLSKLRDIYTPKYWCPTTQHSEWMYYYHSAPLVFSAQDYTLQYKQYSRRFDLNKLERSRSIPLRNPWARIQWVHIEVAISTRIFLFSNRIFEVERICGCNSYDITGVEGERKTLLP